MINIDDRLLKKMDANETYLMLHIAKRLNSQKYCWPSNDKLLEDTGWHIQKLQKIKNSLVKKGLMEVERRGDKTNIYTVIADGIGVFISCGRVSPDEVEDGVKSTTQDSAKSTSQGGGKSGSEVLASKALTNEPNADPSGSAMKGKLFTDAIEAYDDFCKSRFHVGAKIDGAQGNAMKKIMVYLRANSHEKSDEGVLNAWKYILQNWEKLDDWLKGQVKLTQINSNMLNIINQLKYGHNSRSTGTTAATIDALEALARKLETGG